MLACGVDGKHGRPEVVELVVGDCTQVEQATPPFDPTDDRRRSEP
jgi:hypothetical protein